MSDGERMLRPDAERDTAAAEPAPAVSPAPTQPASTRRVAAESDPARPVPTESEPARPASTESEPARPVEAAVEPPSPDVTLADEASPLPGVHRGGFLRLPTAPIAVTSQSAPAEPGTEDDATQTAQWLMPTPDRPQRGLAGWALAASVIGLIASLFVGWGFPIGLVGVVSAILALRRPLESRPLAVWALVIGAVSVLYSAGWLLYAAARASLIG